MVAAQRFEDLRVWQSARDLTKIVYSFSRDGGFAKDWGLSSQVQRSAVSIMSNIAEGFERFRRGEFVQFLSIAKGSCGELRSQLYVAHDLGYIGDADFESTLKCTEMLSKQIGALRSYVEKDIARLKSEGKGASQNPEPRTQNQLGGASER